MNSFLKVAIMLTAYDQMSREIQAACGKSKKELTDLKNHARNEFAQGMGLVGAGMTGFAAIKNVSDEFATLEKASLSLRSVMMKKGGIVDESEFAAISKIANQLGSDLPGTTEDFYKMFALMIKNGGAAKDIIDGTGKSAAYLSIALDKPYADMAETAIRLKNITGIANKDTADFFDLLSKSGAKGAKIEELTGAFQRSAGAMKLLKVQGLDSSKYLASIFTNLIVNYGQQGERMGSGLTAITDALYDPKKMEKFNEVTKSAGLNLKFMDSTGNFLGLENMMSQFDKLKGLDTNKIQEAALALAGTGNDKSMILDFVTGGLKGTKDMTDAMGTLASMNDKVESQLKGLALTEEAMGGTWTNLKAQLGSALAPTLIKIYNLMNIIMSATQTFLADNPKLAKFVMLMFALGSAFLVFAGVVKILKAVRTAMIAFNIVCAANPYVLIAAAIIAVVAALYIWRVEIKNFMNIGGGWVKWLFMLVNPIAFIIVYIDEIIAAFRSIPARIAKLGPGFKNAGKNIAKTIFTGFNLMSHMPVNAIADMTKKMRDYLPFSPAKVGAFKDLHKIKIIETIAGAMKPGPMVKAMSYAMSATASASGPRGNASGGTGGGVTLHYAPVITIGAGTNKEDFAALLKEHANEVMRMIKEKTANVKRREF